VACSRGILIHNPCSGRGRRLLGDVERALKRSGYSLESHQTRAPGHATDLAQSAAHNGAGFVFALGGDGTLREIAAGLLGTETVLVPLPAGTTNVVAMELGLPLDSLRAVGALENARVQSIDVGLCAGMPFLMQASAGFDALVLSRLSPVLKRHLGKIAFAFTGLRELWRYETPRIKYTLNGKVRHSSFVAACNIPRYAGAFRLAPTAALDSGRLHVISFRGTDRRRVLSFAWDLVRGRHLERDDVDLEDTDHLELVGPEDVDVQLDGDAFRFSMPIDIRLAADKLRILRPW